LQERTSLKKYLHVNIASNFAYSTSCRWVSATRQATRFVVVLLLVIGAAGFSAGTCAEEAPAAAAGAARGVMARLNADLTTHFEMLTKLAQNRDLHDLLKSGDLQAFAAAENSLLKYFKGGLRVRLIRVKQAVLAADESPPLTYASLDAIRLAEESTTPVAAELIVPGTPAQHILMVQRLADQDGTLLGVLVLHLAPDLVVQSFAQRATTEPVLEIHQASPGAGDALIASSNPAARAATTPQRLPIPHSRWSLYYWPSGLNVAEGVESAARLPLVPGFLGLVASALIGWYVWQRRKATAESKVPAIRPTAGWVEPSTDSSAVAATYRAGAASGAVEDRHASPAANEQIFLKREQAMEPEPSANSVAAVQDSVFRAYDIRGVVGEGLTEETVYLMGLALGSEAHERGQQDIVVARDGRTSGPILIEALKKGLLESGRDVIDIGMVPTPVLYWATYFLETHSGVMLTGSHNPANYNGLKIMLDGRALAGEAITAIRDRIRSRNFTAGAGTLHTADLGADYIRRITDDIPVALSRSYKVVVDCGNGVPGILAPRLIRALGHDVTEIYCEVDGEFPNHHPDPSQPENLRDLIATVKREHADLGLAFDGDGDRLGVVDGQGNIIWPDRQMMLFARDVLSRNAGAEIIFDVKCSNHLQTVIAKHGGKPLMWKTGHSLIKSKMRESGAPLAGEMSGHIFFKERWYGFDDALYAAARLLEILVKDPRPCSTVFAELPGGVATPELRLDMAETQHAGFMHKLVEKADFGPEATLTTVDGLRVDFADRWALVRPSNTTPCLILRFEADDQAALTKIQDQFRQLLTAVQPGLKLPF
jgi:phosphomannomutase / phosphoglucomutase